MCCFFSIGCPFNLYLFRRQNQARDLVFQAKDSERPQSVADARVVPRTASKKRKQFRTQKVQFSNSVKRNAAAIIFCPRLAKSSLAHGPALSADPAQMQKQRPMILAPHGLQGLG